MRDHALTCLRKLLIEQEAQNADEMTDKQLDYELNKARMSWTSRPLNDLFLKTSLFLQDEYVSLFKYYFRQVRERKSAEEVCDRKWLLHEG